MQARCAAVALTALALSGCSPQAPEDPFYVNVDLLNADATKVKNAYVEVFDDTGTPLTTFCLKLDASFNLKRGFGEDPSPPVQIVVTPEGSISGDQDVNAGDQFGCSADKLPMAVGASQSITVGFCDATAPDRDGVDRHAARVLRFKVGATCATPCGDGLTCGAGLSTSAAECRSDECCSATIADACALLPSK